MSRPFLCIGRVERRLANGQKEELRFDSGVNLLVGRPNTGKTKWLQTLDYLLGDPGENPFGATEEEGLAEKYDAAEAELVIGEEHLLIERRWKEPGARTRIFVNGQGMAGRDLQHLLMQKLGIPLLNFPKGNPISGQTWPELSFRMQLRHIYRQQRFWSDIADLQPDGEQHACLLQFLGLAERVFTAVFGQLIKLKMEVERLKARRDQYAHTLNDLAGDVVSELGLITGINVTTVRDAQQRVIKEFEVLHQRRAKLIANARDKVLPSNQRARTEKLGEERAKLLVGLSELQRKAEATAVRANEMRRYRTDLGDELERMARAEDAGAVLADLRITHCPACDQPIVNTGSNTKDCFLCHQQLPEEPMVEDLGAVRLQFERNRVVGEIKEADELLDVLRRETKRLHDDVAGAEERLRMLENELIPARQAVAALIQEEISGIDMALGELNERQRQLGRVSAALGQDQELSERIATIEREIEPLQARLDEAVRATDFATATAQLEDGMNTYISALNVLRPGVWRHSPVTIDISRWSSTIRVGNRRWQAALGGTDTLYFLMAYHYGLMTLSDKTQRHYPGLSIIDLPAEIAGDAVEDKENFIVQPFIDLFARNEYEGAQLIIAGASFAGLGGARRLPLSHVYVT